MRSPRRKHLLDASQAVEEASSQHKGERLQAEILQDLEAAGSYIAKYGSFADLMREHHRALAED